MPRTWIAAANLAAFVRPMRPADNLELKTHRNRLAFYYERASVFEVSMMDSLCWLNTALTLAVNAPREHLPVEFLNALEKTTDALEGIFMEAAAHVRNGVAYRSLVETERDAVESRCLRIQFLDG